MKVDKDTVALIVNNQDNWKTTLCAVTQFKKDRKWICGEMLVTDLTEVMKTAEKYNLNVIPESVIRNKSKG